MDRLAIIEWESQRLADVLATSDPGLKCPTCPAWTASDLLWHLTEVHFFWAAILAQRAKTDADVSAVEQDKPDRPQATADLLALREEATRALLGQLAILDDTVHRWSWWPPDQTVGFTRRMQTYEATMHRVDAEVTAGLPIGPIADDVSSGAVDHAVDVMWGWLPDGATRRPRGVVEFVASDTGGRWLVEVGSWTAPAQRPGETGETVAGPLAVRATGGEPTATVNAPVGELALWAWTRGGAVETVGDSRVLASLEAVITQGMQ